MVDAGQRAQPAELSSVAAEMAGFIGNRRIPLQEAGIVALCVGTVTEQGASPNEAYAAIKGRLPDVLNCAERLAAAVADAFPPSPDKDEPEPPEDAFWVGSTPVPSPWVREFASRDRDAIGAYNTLDNWCLPIISMATRHRPLLQSLIAEDQLKTLVAPLSPWHGSARFLEMLLHVQLQERLLLLDARSGRAFDLMMDGVTINFTLHSLLSAALARALGHELPPREVLDVLHARKGQRTNLVSSGTWNLYTWRAAAWLPDQLDDAPHEHWVWNEGLPSKIPAWEGTRVVIAGQPTIERTWNTCRTFAFLAEQVTLLHELSPADARHWVERMQGAAGKQ